MSDTAQEAKREVVKQAVVMAFFLLTMFLYMAMMSPDWLRTQLMKASLLVQRSMAKFALMAGHASMTNELQTGTANYGLPYALSRARDKAAALYEKARGMGR